MAAASVQRSPLTRQPNMAHRRTPLAQIPNAGNSPFRGGGSSAAKRARHTPTHASHGLEHSLQQQEQHQPPPSKRQAIDTTEGNPVTPRKVRSAHPATVTPNQRQHAARTREIIRTREAASKNPTQSKESLHVSMEKLRQWQKHNEKTFPTYVFFFENVPEGARRECSKGIRALGSREATFFSKEVTHIVTTRAIPVEEEPVPTEPVVPVAVRTSPRNHARTPARTIDPAVLEKDRSHDSLAAMSRSKFTFEAPRKALVPSTEAENRNVQPSDILIRAKRMGMKIWGLDKLKRILDVMFEETDAETTSTSRSKLTHTSARPQHGRPQDLQQLISNEQLNGPLDRDATGVYNDVVTWKGPFIYVRCCFERTRPIMFREWPKVANREDGEWPQFRSVSSGKCPFVEEDPRARKAPTKGDRAHARRVKDDRASRRAESATTSMQPPSIAGRKRTLGESEAGNKAAPAPGRTECENDAMDIMPATISREDSLTGRSGVSVTGREPMASGMQASNITSAIRSQVISSTAAAPGAKAGTSREMHGLQRKVLGRGGAPSSLSRPAGMTNLAGSARTTRESEVEQGGGRPGTRAATQRAQERMCLGQSRLAQVWEHPEGDEGDGEATEEMEEVEDGDGGDAPDADVAATARVGQTVPARSNVRGRGTKAAAARVGKSGAATTAVREKREAKPGFCENCREKFDDFEEHTLSKRHRKFAATKENWEDLDRLLGLLVRPQLRIPWSDVTF